MLRATLKGSLYITASLVLVKALSMIYTALIARVLGPEGLGAINLAMVMVPWFISLSSFSLQTVATRLLSSLQAKNKDLLPYERGLFLLTFAFGFGATLIHLLIAPFVATTFFHDAHLARYISIASVIVLLSVLYNTLLGVERGLKHFKLYAVLEFLKQFLLLCVGLFFVLYLGYGVKGALFALILSPALLLVFYFFKHREIFAEAKIEHRGMLATGVTLGLVGFVLALFMSLDEFIVGFLQTKTQVGLYAASISIMNMGIYLVGGIKNTLFPFLTEKYTQLGDVRDKEFVHYFSKINTFTLIAIGYFLIGAMIFRYEIILLIFGQKYIASIQLLSIVLFALPFLSLYILLHTFALSTNRIREVLTSSIIAVVLSAGILYFLTKSYGVVGTAYGLVTSSFILFLSYYFFILRGIRAQLSSLFFLILVICLFGIAAQYFSGLLWRNVLLFVLATILYPCTLYLFRFLEKEEFYFIWSKIRGHLIRK